MWFEFSLLMSVRILAQGNPVNMDHSAQQLEYRFDVHPVDRCPMNKSEFESAAKRRNCTGTSRYLCAPNRNLRNLIEFCTDINRSLFQSGNCLRLEGTGYLNHYKCVDRFVKGCPNVSYFDENLYLSRFDAISKQRTADTKKLKDRLSRIEEKMTGMKVDFKSTISVSGMTAIRHISFLTPDALWVSNGYKIKQVNSKGDVIKTVPDEYEYASDGGFHSVSKEGDLFFIGRIEERGAVYRMTSDGRITLLVQSELSRVFTCIHCSHINGDILIGVDSRTFPLRIHGCRVLRCDSTGRRIQEIEFKDQEHTERLYGHPQYITENRINGDIVVSDKLKEALVVVDRSGRHRFDYTGHNSLEEFNPVGVCTDGLGRILVAHYLNYFGYNYMTCISVLDQDGRFLYTLLTEDGRNPCTALYVDDKFNIYSGKGNKIKVFKESNFP